MKRTVLCRLAAALSLACAALALLFASTSSPLYATNFWTDTNIYFTVGRGMLSGLMPYRDLFDHKGPLLYAIYALGALVSDSSFLGVFLLEVASLAATLYLGWRTVCLCGDGPLTLAAIPLAAAVTATCTAFNQGGSAEEFCLPALALGLLCALARMRGARPERPGRLHALFGAAAGWVFAIKYTDCGLFFGLGAMLLCWELRMGGSRAGLRALLAMIAGFAIAPLACAAYLAAGGALGDCIRVYVTQNITGYGGAPLSATGHVYNALAYLRTQSAANPAVAGIAALGCAWTFVSALRGGGKGSVFAAMAVPLGAGLLLLFCYWGEMAHPYYALVFAALLPAGLAPLGALAARLPRRSGAYAALALALTLLLAPLCRALCAATPLLTVRREDMPQTRFAQIVREDPSPTLLDVSGHDQGFYLAAGVLPNCRYFADNNLDTEEKREAIAGYLAQGAARFVVTRWRDPGARYELVAEASGPFDLSDWRDYRLYRLREE